MMKSALYVLIAASLSFAATGSGIPAYGRAQEIPAGTDSAKTAALSLKVEEYLRAIETEPVEVQKREADFLIETCSDPETRQTVALKIYGHYLNSDIMGAEAIAVYVCDKWFIPGKIQMKSDTDLLNARIFAEFNRNSLIGMRAPEMELEDESGNPARLFRKEGESPREDDIDTGGRFSILYFYSTDCPKCRVESLMLKHIVETNDFPVNLYCIYTGDDKGKWTEYVEENLSFGTRKTRTGHFWDPGSNSDFQLNYGLLQTPGIFLINPSGIIEGRRLDAVSLAELLETLLSPVSMEYGSDESSEFYDMVFAPFKENLKCSDIMNTARYVRSSVLDSGDTVLFKQMTGDLMYYLSGKRGREFKCGLDSLIREFITGNPVWNTEDDSLKVVDFASVLSDLLSKAPEGRAIPEQKVSGTLLEQGRKGKPVEKKGMFSLRKLPGKRNIIIFHTEGCPICKEEIEAAKALLSEEDSGKTSVLLIDMDELFSCHPDQAEALLGEFDLTALPYITETDRKGTVISRYSVLSLR